MSGKYPSTFYRIGIKAMIRNEKGELLLVKERQSAWSLPGGGMEHGESMHDALKRELYEEVLIESDFTEELIDTETMYLDYHEAYLIWMVHKVTVDKLTYGLGQDATEVGFVDPETLKDSKHLSERLVYGLHKKHPTQVSRNKLQLELHVDDFTPIKEYYGKLGFAVVWEHPPKGFDGYLVIEKEGNTICFWSGNQEVYDQPHFKQFARDTARGYGVEVVVMVSDIHAFYDHVKDTANVVEPLIKQPWGLWDFRAVDPAGYYLRFTSEHDVLSNSHAIKK